MLKKSVPNHHHCWQYTSLAIAAINRMLAENAELTVAQCIEALNKELEDE